MMSTRSQEGDLKGKGVNTEDPKEQGIAQWEEFKTETRQQFDAIIGILSRLQGNQRSDDQFTLDRSTTPSVKAKGSGSDVFEESREDRRFRDYLMHRNDEDDETWTWTEHYSVMDDETDSLEEELMPQFQVPVSDSEILKSIELGKVDLGLENEEYVVLNENLEQEWVQKKVKTSFEADGDVERGQKTISDTETSCAHKVLVKMPSKEKCMKHLKAWKFKFKPTSKRSRLMDDKISFVDATVLLNKDPQEIIWDCVNKELKEIVDGCGKTRVDPFKLVQATPRPGDYDRPLQSSVWNSGGSLLECVDEESFGDDKIKEWLFKVEEFFSIDFTHMELKVKLVSNHFDGDTANWHQSQVQTGQFGHLLIDWGAYKVLLKERFENVFEDSIAKLKQLQETKGVKDEIEPVTDKEMLVMPHIAVNANLGFSEYNNKRMKGTHDKRSLFILIDLDSAHNFIYPKIAEKWGCEIKSAGLTRVSVTGGNKLGVLGLKKVEPITWRFKKLEMRFMTNKQKELPRESEAEVFLLDCNSLVTTISLEVGQLLRQFQELFEKLSLDSMMFEQTFSSITEPKKILPSFFRLKHKWRSRISHSFSEMKQRMIGRVWKSFGYLMEDMMEEDQKQQGDSEPLLTVPDFAAKICETFDQYIRKKGSVRADRVSESNQPTLRFSTWVIEILLNHYMVLLLTPVAYAIHFLGGVGMNKKQSHLSLWINRVWDPGRSLVKDASYSTRIFSSLPATVPVSLLCQESFAYQITSFSTNLEVKVSLKGEDVIQDKRMR